MGKLKYKEAMGMVCIGVLLVGLGIFKGDIGSGNGWIKSAEEAPIEVKEVMWSEESPNNYKQVMVEIDRLNQLFSKSVGLHESFVAYYKENNRIPDDYAKQLDEIVVASPYDEVKEFLAIQIEYKTVQREYFDYIHTEATWDKNYLKEKEMAMSQLIQEYMSKLDKIKKNNEYINKG